MAIAEAPFDEDGNMVSYPNSNYNLVDQPDGTRKWVRVEPVLQPVEPFNARMRVVGMETGRSAKRLVLEDLDTGKRYPLFVADIVKLLQDSGTVLTGTWAASKRGQNYGIKRLP